MVDLTGKEKQFVDKVVIEKQVPSEAVKEVYAESSLTEVGASKKAKEMIIRLPYIPGVNDDNDNLHALGRFIKEELKSVRTVHVLPYHSTGESKSYRLGKEYVFHAVKEQTKSDMERARDVLSSYGIQVQIGG